MDFFIRSSVKDVAVVLDETRIQRDSSLPSLMKRDLPRLIMLLYNWAIFEYSNVETLGSCAPFERSLLRQELTQSYSYQLSALYWNQI